MWFGDLVTMRWFNDVWMKEVFANFMAAKIVNPSFPQVNHELRFLLAHYPVGVPGGSHGRDQPDPAAARAISTRRASCTGAIIYQKAPIVMRQLEMIVGEKALRDGLREYLKRYAFGNATWLDLIRILDARTPQNWRPGAARGSRSAGVRSLRPRRPIDAGGAIARARRWR